MNTKLKGDLAEYAFILESVKKDWNVLKPIGDRLPYDLVIENNNVFIRIQVKSSWFDESSGNYITDVRRCKTNRRVMKHEKYSNDDFDFAAIFIEDLNIWYIMPIEVFNSYASTVSLVVEEKRQRKPKSHQYKESWDLIVNRFLSKE